MQWCIYLSLVAGLSLLFLIINFISLTIEYRQAANAGASMLEREVGGAYSSTIICRDCFKVGS